jgi:hypothetical protein
MLKKIPESEVIGMQAHDTSQITELQVPNIARLVITGGDWEAILDKAELLYNNE